MATCFHLQLWRLIWQSCSFILNWAAWEVLRAVFFLADFFIEPAYPGRRFSVRCDISFLADLCFAIDGQSYFFGRFDPGFVFIRLLIWRTLVLICNNSALFSCSNVIFLFQVDYAGGSRFLTVVDWRRLPTTDPEKHFTSRFFVWWLRFRLGWFLLRSWAMPHKLNALNRNFVAFIGILAAMLLLRLVWRTRSFW
jgi:hypothetical protein